jgi:hypothetical protein
VVGVSSREPGVHPFPSVKKNVTYVCVRVRVLVKPTGS